MQSFTVDVFVDLSNSNRGTPTDVEDAVRTALYNAGYEHLHAVTFKQNVTPSRPGPECIQARCISCGVSVGRTSEFCSDCG
jgi:hypothetical protein